MKKILLISLFSLGLLSLAGTSLATENNSNVEPELNISNTLSTELIGVHPVENILNRGTSIPSQSWNIHTKGQYNFSAGNVSGYLFSNYSFYGDPAYEYHFYNQGWSPITINFRNISSHASYKSIVLQPQSSTSSSLTNMNTGTQFYIEFYGSNVYSFNGYIR